jgi:2-hydroxy-3-keto-5-methylthiopentenyl-1-phosphate phosphatase
MAEQVNDRPAKAPPAPFRVFLDFDGTLVGPNVAIVLVEKFAKEGARVANEVDLQLHRGEITLRQAWDRQAALLPADRIPEMRAWAAREIPLRAGAHELVDLLTSHSVPTVVLSGGLDFYIDAVLEREGWDLPVMSDTLTTSTTGGLTVLHPHGHETCRLCGICKAQTVRSAEVLPGAGRTIFIGDGSTDKYAAEVADIVFARRRLLDYCRERGIPCYPFEEFPPVTRQLRKWLEEGEPLPAPRSIGLADSPCPISRTLGTTPARRVDGHTSAVSA